MMTKIRQKMIEDILNSSPKHFLAIKKKSQIKCHCHHLMYKLDNRENLQKKNMFFILINIKIFEICF